MRLRREAAPLGVAGEHAEQVARPQARLVAAGAGADLDDDVLAVVGVALDHGEPDLLLELGDAGAGAVEQLAQLGVLAVLGDQLLGPGGVVLRAPPLLREPGGGRELVEQAARLGVAPAVADHRGVRHLRLRVREAGLDLLDEPLDHAAALRLASAAPGGTTARSAATATASCAASGSRVVSRCSRRPGAQEHARPAPVRPPDGAAEELEGEPRDERDGGEAGDERPAAPRRRRAARRRRRRRGSWPAGGSCRSARGRAA